MSGEPHRAWTSGPANVQRSLRRASEPGEIIRELEAALEVAFKPWS